MPDAKRKIIIEEQWVEAVDAYERGTKHAVEIAGELGVSPATVSREFKRRGSQKGSRAAETVTELEASLDANARRRAARQHAREKAAWARSAAMDHLIAEMMQSIIAASKAGDLTKAKPTIEEVGRSLGVKPSR